MTTIALPGIARRTAVHVPDGPTARARRALKDGLVVTERNLLAFTRTPEALFFMTLQPIMFVVMFRYVFGGAIHIPGFDYKNYMMPGIFVQTAAFGSVGTAVGMAEDLHKGLLERFRALPMARSAVLVGRSAADLVRGLLVIVAMTGVGLAVGFRPKAGIIPFIASIGLLLLFLHALSWGFSVIGLIAPNSETAQVMAFPVLFPLTFASSAFVSVQSMPGWLQAFANHQPVSAVIDASRALMLGGPTSKHVIVALAWCLGIVAVLAPVAVYRYRRTA